MSEERIEQPRADRDPSTEPISIDQASPSAPATEPFAPRPFPPRQRPWAAASLLTLLLLVIAVVLLSPFWAPTLTPLLPWGEKATARKYDALAERVAALEQRPIVSPSDSDAVKLALRQTGQRVAALESALDTMRQNQQAASATTATVAQLTQHVDEIAAQSAARESAQANQIEKLQLELAQRGAADGAVANRLDALERQVHALATVDRSGSVMLLALLQLREAVQEARPFSTDYAAFKQLAARDPDLIAAAEPLADAARDGVASRAVLQQRLADLADKIGAPVAPTGKPKWWSEALDRLRGLVTIHHLDRGAKTGPGAAVEAARTDLAQGELGDAVAEIGKLTGANAEAAQPWLHMARQRLVTETALRHLQELLTTRLASPAAASPATTVPSAAPNAAPQQPAAAPKTPC
jgi:hypothetical protein